ncbi:MAG: preprotein translocase subunit SecE [Planctomycetia bacterium]|nr:preprotein translocase subunit SecE [Planctomycetia bacterium]
MALAVQDAPSASSSPRKADPASLSWNGIVGTLYVVLAYLAITHLVPWGYSQVVTSTGLAAGAGLLAAICLAVALAIFLWLKLFPAQYGLRAAVAVGVGNIILGFIVIFLLGYIVDGIFGTWLENLGIRFWLGMAFMGALAAWWINRFIIKSFNAPNFPKRMQKLEDGGWFTAEPYKKVQGMKIRRITMLVIIATVGLGVYAYIWSRNTLSVTGSPYVWDIPFVSDASLILFRAAGLMIPFILLAGAIWFAYRLVNHPPMAEFLINTEAELAKVTWTSRKRLIRDTGVVLLTVLFFAVFLYLLDIIWVLVLTALGVLQR